MVTWGSHILRTPHPALSLGPGEMPKKAGWPWRATLVRTLDDLKFWSICGSRCSSKNSFFRASNNNQRTYIYCHIFIELSIQHNMYIYTYIHVYIYIHIYIFLQSKMRCLKYHWQSMWKICPGSTQNTHSKLSIALAWPCQDRPSHSHSKIEWSVE